MALKDGTVLFAYEDRKPYRRPGERDQFVDEDGCYGWSIMDAKYPAQNKDANRIIITTAMVNALNVRKAIRNQVEKRLDRIETQLSKVTEMLERLERP
jgi:hypothetical protein